MCLRTLPISGLGLAEHDKQSRFEQMTHIDDMAGMLSNLRHYVRKGTGSLAADLDPNMEQNVLQSKKSRMAPYLQMNQLVLSGTSCRSLAACMTGSPIPFWFRIPMT
jgi:hypothetical protein